MGNPINVASPSSKSTWKGNYKQLHGLQLSFQFLYGLFRYNLISITENEV